MRDKYIITNMFLHLLRKMQKQKFGILIVVLVLAFAYIFPILWMFVTSLRCTRDIYSFPPKLLPQCVTIENYTYVLTKMKYFKNYFVNSIIVTISTVVIVSIASSMGGYVFGMYRFRGQQFLFSAIMLVLSIPYIMYLIPIYIMEQKFRLLNTWLGLILPYVALNLPWGLLIMRGAFSTIPREIREAALIDGCNELQLWWKVLLPITKPSLAATIIITFVFAWQEYMFASTLMTKNEWQTLPVGIVWIKDELQTVAYGRIGATVMLSILPVFVLFLLFRKFFIRGLAEGMLKG